MLLLAGPALIINPNPPQPFAWVLETIPIVFAGNGLVDVNVGSVIIIDSFPPCLPKRVLPLLSIANLVAKD